MIYIYDTVTDSHGIANANKIENKINPVYLFIYIYLLKSNIDERYSDGNGE